MLTRLTTLFMIILLIVQYITIKAQPIDGCDGVSASTGLNEYTVVHDEIQRRYLLYVPESYDGVQALPLVISIHGFASSPQQQADISKWNEVADEHGFFVVYPRGTGFPLRWNSGQHILGEQGADDVGFITAMLDQIETDFCIDSARIYVNGLSNGAGMSNRLICEMADRFAAMGGVAGAYNPLPGGCKPVRLVPIIAFHGTDDPIVPFEGGRAGGLDLPYVESWARTWARRNGCDRAPEETQITKNVSRMAFDGCDADADVVLYTITGGGHTWPGGMPLPEFITGITTQEIHASELMWEFFVAHPQS